MFRKFVFVFVFVSFINSVNGQGFGIGQASPSEILHLTQTGTSNTAIRFDCQTTAGSSTDTYNSAGATAPSSDNSNGGTIDWTNPTNVTTADDGTYADATAGTSKYLKYVGSSSLFSAIGASDQIVGISVAVDRTKTLIGRAVALLDTWSEDEASSVAVSGGSTSTTSSSFNVSTGADRMAVIVVSTTDATDNNITGVSWNGAAFTQAGEVSAVTGGVTTRQEIWYLKEASITTGSSAVTITWTTGSVTQDIVDVAMASYQYVDQITTGDYRSNTSLASGTLAPSATAAAVNMDMVIGAAASGQDDNAGNSNYDPPASYTEYLDGDNSTGGDMSWEIIDMAVTAGATQQPTFDFQSTDDVTDNAQMVSVFVLKYSSSTSACTVYDNSVRLYKAGSVTGSDKADATTNWTTSDVTITYGSSSDLWGASWTPADIQDAGFGVGIAATAAGATGRIDYITITVTYIASGNFGNYVMGIEQSSGKFKIANSTALGTNDRITINTSGDVGIGTVSPAEKLEVCGNLKVVGTITAQGAIATNGAITCSSDLRFKKNIFTLNNALDNVLLLRGVSYDWRIKEFPERNFLNKKQIGFIAQEVEKIYPELVMTDKDGFKSVDYSRFTPILVEAIKEQQQSIKTIETKIAQASAKLEKYNSLELRIISLENKINSAPAGFFWNK